MDRVQKRFDELNELAAEVAQTTGCKTVRRRKSFQIIGAPTETYEKQVETIDQSLLREWRTSVLSLLERVFGMSSPTYQEFASVNDSYLTPGQFLSHLLPIFHSAKSDYEGGYLFDIRNLVHAEVFSDELEQAEHFLEASYKVAAAVIAGVVLETTLRKLCVANGLDTVKPNGKPKTLDPLNTDLAKAGVYNSMRQKQVTTWADLRNKAAHGNSDEYDNKDVALMIEGIRDFVANLLN